ncbi:MAG: hypothetical protein PVH05_01090, partial [Burkholderiales bacterium]
MTVSSDPDMYFVSTGGVKRFLGARDEPLPGKQSARRGLLPVAHQIRPVRNNQVSCAGVAAGAGDGVLSGGESGELGG